MQSSMVKVTVVVPIRNEKANIAECIHAIYASELPEGWQLYVVCVDGQSDDGTLDILHQLQQRYPSIEIISNHRKITPVAFNLGVQHAQQSDYIQRVDARQIISPNYIHQAVVHMQGDATIWCVGGRMNNVYQNATGKTIASATASSLGMGFGNSRVSTKSMFVDTVHTPIYPKWVFDKVGLFDESLIRNQDDDFNFRVAQAGGKIYLDTSIWTNYYVRGSYRHLWKQFFQYGYWKVYVNKKHKTFTTIRQLVPPLFTAYLMVFLLGWLISPLVALASSVPLIIYLFAVGITSAIIASRNPAINFFNSAKTFFILHLSYGFGYLNGVFDFFILRKKPAEKHTTLSR